MVETTAEPMAGRPVNGRRTVVDLIKDYIVQHRLQAGDPMPTESELCEELGASRSSVREAVKTLAALDIVEVRHGFGTFVGSLSLRALVESLAFRGFLSGRGDRNVLLDLVEIRQMLELGMAGRMVAAMDDDLAGRLTEVTRAMDRRARRGEDFPEQDREFHLMLMRPLGNDLAVQFTGAFWDAHSMAAPALGPSSVGPRATVQHHVDIVQTAVAGDEAALRAAIVRHYDPIRERIRHQLGN